MDAFAVSVGYGICQKKIIFRSAFRLSFHTALFQMIMPLIGWISGKFLGKIVSNISPFISFALLFLIGIKMIIEALKREEECRVKDISRGKELIIVCIATSIDAFAAGVSIGLIKIPLVISIVIIGTITFVLSILGVYIGRLIGKFIEKWAEIIGGVILILIGVKILVEKIFF